VEGHPAATSLTLLSKTFKISAWQCGEEVCSWLSAKGLSPNMTLEGWVHLSASPNPETAMEPKKSRR